MPLVAAVLLGGAAMYLWLRPPPLHPGVAYAAPAEAGAPAAAAGTEALVAPVSDVSPATKEQRRFNRYDHDKNGEITQEEYLASRRKAFAKLDLNGDGKLSFDEYSAKAIKKFAVADASHDGKLTPVEFATTAVKRKPRPINCPPVEAAAPAARDEEG